MSISKLILFILIGLVVCGAIGLGITLQFRHKIAHANLNQVYNDFTLKKLLEKRLDETKQSKQNYLDSLGTIVERQESYFAAHGSKDAALNRLIVENKKALSEKEDEINRSLEAMASGYQNQIWQQVNTYVKEYGRINDYDFIYGADGKGTLMYAKESSDISLELIEYINKRYKGE